MARGVANLMHPPTGRRTRLLCTEPLEGRWLLSALGSALSPDADLDGGDDEGDDGARVATHQLPAPVLASLYARFPGAKLVEAELTSEDGRRVYEVTAEFAGREVDVTLAPDGDILEAETEAPQPGTQVPDDSETDAPERVPVVPKAPMPEAAPVIDSSAAPAPAANHGPVQVLEVESEDDVENEEVEVAPSQLPADVLNALAARFPTAEVIEAELDTESGAPEWDVIARLNGGLVEITFTPGGDVVETEQSLTIDDLPREVRDWARRKYPGWRIEEATLVSNAGGESYDLVVADPAGRQQLEATVRVQDARTSGGEEALAGRDAKTRGSESGERAAAVEPAAPNAPAESVAAASSAPENSAVASSPPADNESEPAQDDEAAADTQEELIEDGPGNGFGAALHALVAGAAQASWVPQVAGVLSDVLPVEVAVLERRLRGILEEAESFAQRAARGQALVGGSAVRLVVAVALAAVVQLLTPDPRRRRGGRAVVFNASSSTWGWVLGSVSTKRRC
jgi:hypothetical protein